MADRSDELPVRLERLADSLSWLGDVVTERDRCEEVISLLSPDIAEGRIALKLDDRWLGASDEDLDPTIAQGFEEVLADRRERILFPLDEDARWSPVFVEEAGRGLTAACLTPLFTERGDVGILLLFYRDGPPAPLLDRGPALVSEMARWLDAALIAGRAVEAIGYVSAAIGSRAAIEQAKGILMEREKCSADEAFDILRRSSQAANRKLRDIAAELVASISRS